MGNNYALYRVDLFIHTSQGVVHTWTFIVNLITHENLRLSCITSIGNLSRDILIFSENVR